MSKTLYHSELAGMGDVDVLVKDPAPKPSKYQGKPDIIFLVIQGNERIYNVENQNCGAALTGLQGQTVTLRAEGSRDDATITVFDAPSGHHQPNPQPRHRDPNLPQRPPAQQQQMPPARNPAPSQQPAASGRMTKEQRAAHEFEAFKKASRASKQIGILFQLCLDRAMEITVDKLTNEDRRQIAITMFIELKGRIDIHALPIELPQSAAPAQPFPARQPAPPRQPEPPPDDPGLDPAEEDDIPF